jgi:hypothetical protein
VIVVLMLAIQLVPYRVTNPDTRDEPPWNSPRTRELAVAACFDCHSNETELAWFERIAPISWRIKGHVDEGRSELNFSEWRTNPGDKVEDAAEVVLEGEMPLDEYTRFGLHPEADLSAAERRELAAGLVATLDIDDD